MKLRFSSLDVKVIAKELNSSLLSLRISNIYDLSSRIFLFKCAKPGHKAQLLVDPGFRCHLTSFSRTAEPSPSAFVTRLRKYLKTRRITAVSQLGTDRVIEITFSDGQYRLFLEFFAAGNIVLTDKELTVLALWRQVSEGDEDVDVKLGGKYVLEAKQNYNGIPPLTQERVRTVLESQIQRNKDAQEAGGKKAKRQKGGDDLKKALSMGLSEYPPLLLEHVFIQTGFDSTKKPTDVLESEQLFASVMTALKQTDDLYHKFETATEIKGYIIAKEKTPSEAVQSQQDPALDPGRKSLLYEDFHPFRPSQFEGKEGIHIVEADSFNKTVDDFYSSIESQKLEGRLTEREEAARKKLEAAKNEHQKRLGALQEVQEMHVRKAQAIEANTHRVEEAIAAVNGLIAQGMDWVDIGKLIENEQKRDNVVAQTIKLPLKLHENTVTLLLSEPGITEDSDDDEADETDSESESDNESTGKSKAKAMENPDKRLAIDIDLASTPWSNARQYYDQKRTAAVKEQRTMQAADKALKSMEKKTEADLKKGLKQEKTGLRPARRQLWFEKFVYFLSSDGYLVIGGKDATQNELLYRRYLQRGDIYVHADLNGASSVIVKNNPTTPDAPIPPSTLSQAGALTVCTSSAWDSKAVMAAWWVEAHQVSKTAPTGEYIKTGGFMIKGKKNFLPPTQLILGFGVIWQISEASRANHGKHRIQRTESMIDGEAEALAADAKGLSIENPEPVDGTGNEDNAIPDLEDAAQDAEKEIQEDEEAGFTSEDDRASTVADDVEQPRSNPLQLNGQHDEQVSEHDASDEEMGSDHEEHDEQDESNENDPEPHNASKPVPSPSAKDNSQSKVQSKRGKNTKAKRAAAAKYALQTDEERELAMELLGSAKGLQKKEDEAIAKAAREEKARQDRERRKQQHDKAAAAERKRMERLEKGEMGEAALNDEEEMDAEQVAQERKELLNIDLLVPFPEPGDELVAAIPIVAPWSAMGRSKYKVKLQPGSVKKGKLVKEILGNWTTLASKGPKVVDDNNRDKEKVWAREIELMKQWKVEEVVGVVPVKGCRVVQSGGLGAGGGAAHNGRGKGGARGGRGKKR